MSCVRLEVKLCSKPTDSFVMFPLHLPLEIMLLIICTTVNKLFFIPGKEVLKKVIRLLPETSAITLSD